MLSDLTDHQVGWIAGMIDADGYVGMIWHKTKKWYQPMVNVTSVDKHTVETLLALTGLGHIHISRQNDPSRSTIWGWNLTSYGDVSKLLCVVVNHMVTKKVRASTLLTYCYIHSSGDYGEMFYLKLKELNSRKFDK